MPAPVLPTYLIAYPKDGAKPILKEVDGDKAQVGAAGAVASGRFNRVVIARAFQINRPHGEGS